jgi:hypothetical protein
MLATIRHRLASTASESTSATTSSSTALMTKDKADNYKEDDRDKADSEFLFFGRLPLELRWRIWELAAMESREVCPEEGKELRGNWLYYYYSPYYYSSTLVPAVLQACGESRCYLESLSMYRWAFADVFETAQHPQAPYVWINFAADALSIAQSRLDIVKCEIN